MEHRLDFYIVGFQWWTSWERVACVEHQAEPLYKIGKKNLKDAQGIECENWSMIVIPWVTYTSNCLLILNVCIRFTSRWSVMDTAAVVNKLYSVFQAWTLNVERKEDHGWASASGASWLQSPTTWKGVSTPMHKGEVSQPCNHPDVPSSLRLSHTGGELCIRDLVSLQFWLLFGGCATSFWRMSFDL